jgi:hypothetical protein
VTPKEPNPQEWIDGNVRLFYERLTPGLKNEVSGCSNGDLSFIDNHVEYLGERVDVFLGENRPLRSLLYQADSWHPLQDRIYGQISQELPQALEALRKTEGLAPVRRPNQTSQ